MAAPLDALRAALADRYRIDREIGRGGMATVFLAEDLRHGRLVALKVLNPELAAAIGPDRFLREIQTSARLTHPHILPVHDSGAAAGLIYYVMPHVEGESLRARLDREKRLPIPDAIRLGAELARALDYAHAKGVVHRDIKPGNVLLESGQAVLADFGIAQVVGQSAGEHLTQPGMMIGTPLYMSPEQSTAEPVDGRSDLYSLGCVLYEMLSGQPPFTGAGTGSVVRDHLTAVPRPVSELRPGVPEAVDRVLARALSKTPADRFLSGAEMAAALDASLLSSSGTSVAADPLDATVAIPRARRGWSRPVAVAAGGLALLAAIGIAWQQGWLPRRSAPAMNANQRAWILVADFDAPDSNLAAAVKSLVSSALDQSTIVRTVPPPGIREVLVAAGRNPNSRVDADLAHELAFRRSVRAIVDGSIARAGHTYVITARAEDVDSARVITTTTEIAKSEDALIPAAARIGATLRRELGEAPGAVAATRRTQLVSTPSFEALRLHLTAVQLGHVNGDYASAMRLERQATQLDPEFARAWSELASYKLQEGETDSAIVFTRRALQFPSRSSDAERYFLEAKLASYLDDLPRSVALYRQAAELGAPGARMNLAGLLGPMGHLDEQLAIYRDLQKEEWSSGTAAKFNEWIVLLFLGRAQEAARVSADFPPPRSKWAPPVNALVGGDWVVADSLGSRLLGDESEDLFVRWQGGTALAGAEAARGSPSRALAVVDRMISLTVEAPDYQVMSLYLASFLDLLGGRSRDLSGVLTPRDTSEAWRSYMSVGWAAAGDTARSRALIHRLRNAPGWEGRLMTTLAEGLIDWRAGRNQRVVDRLGPLAQTGMFESRLPDNASPYFYRWLVGTAWERMGQPDSAAVYYERTFEPGRTADVSWPARAVILPYSLQRLVVLNARMGRYAEAEKRWQELQKLVTQPDVEFRGLLAAANTELNAARTREGPVER